MRKKYGKTTKQWDRLYNQYKDRLSGIRYIKRMNKTEFIEAYVNRKEGETVRDIAIRTIRETRMSEYQIYEMNYDRLEKEGFLLGGKLSEKAFNSQLPEYGTRGKLLEGQFEVSKKQAANWMKHAAKLGLQGDEDDFRKDSSIAAQFWAEVDRLGGWEAAFEY